MLYRISFLLVVLSTIWSRGGNAHSVHEDHFHLFTEPKYGSQQYMTARETALEKLVGDSRDYVLLQYDVLQVNWPVIDRIVMESTHANGPFSVDLLGLHQCTIPFLERRSTDVENSSDEPTQRFKGRCVEYFGNAKVQFKYDPSKPWIGFTIQLPRGRMILVTNVGEDHVLVQEVRTDFRHDDSEIGRRGDTADR